MQQNEKINLSVDWKVDPIQFSLEANLVHDIEKCLNEVTQSGNKAIWFLMRDFTMLSISSVGNL